MYTCSRSCIIEFIGHFTGSGFPQPVLQTQNVHQGQHPLANAIAPSDSDSDIGPSPEVEEIQGAGRHEAGQMSMPTPEPYRNDTPPYEKNVTKIYIRQLLINSFLFSLIREIAL